MKEKVVQDVMVDQKETVVVGSEATVREVIGAFSRLAFGSCEKDCIVLVKDGPRVVGMITVLDLLQVIEPAFLKGDNRCEVFWDGLFTQRCRNVADKKVSEFMRPPVSVAPGDSLMHLSATINRYKTDVIPVMQDGRVIGIVRASDIVKNIAEAVG
ncbi:cyclic nucleotide-binding/CBS domain-containing protein [Desulforudis sp. 1088]|uniref:CBS domain-containing protein n=1 Tax=unclassified Candidatus Desulforudis TaxID=2635950 RepID=UPI0034891E84